MGSIVEAVAVIQSTVKEHWLAVATLGTGFTYLCGISYYQGFLGSLGFQGLVFSISPEILLSTGAVAFLGTFAATMLFAGIVVLISVAVARLFQLNRKVPPNSARGPTPYLAFFSPSSGLGFLGALVTLSALTPIPWRWLLPYNLAPGLDVPGAIVLVVAMLGGLLALAKLRGRGRALFVALTLMSLAPHMSQQMGQDQAVKMMDHPRDFTRVQVWENATDDFGEMYVFVFQSHDRLYVLEADMANSGGVAIVTYSPIVLHVNSAGRVEFHPPEGVVAQTRPIRS